jgi:hypothetical protein
MNTANQQKLMDSINYEFSILNNQLETLRLENEELKSEVEELRNFKQVHKQSIRELGKVFASMVPVKIYHHKKRGNTTVVFADKSSVTVHRMKGEKDCVDTALAYAIMKKVCPKVLIKNLLKKVEEIEGGE